MTKKSDPRRARKNADDQRRGLELLEETKSPDGVDHLDLAGKLLYDEILEDPSRFAEFAADHVKAVLHQIDTGRKAITKDGQMELFEDTWLVLGQNERASLKHATRRHLGDWMDIQNDNKDRQDVAHAAKTLHAHQLMSIMDEQNVNTVWQAELIRRGVVG